MSLNYARDPQLFMHLWKCRVGSTRSLKAACFSNSSLSTTYARLQKLRLANYICRIRFEGVGGLWTLSVNGFKLLQEEICELKKNGYGSESPVHDQLVAMIAHEDYRPHLPTGWEFLTEEEFNPALAEKILLKAQGAQSQSVNVLA